MIKPSNSSKDEHSYVRGEDNHELDLNLRPKTFVEYIGQKKIKDNLYILLSAAKIRQEPVEHILLYGGPGLGKTTLANIIAKEMNANIKTTSGPAIEKPGDVASILTNLKNGEVLFIDEIHRLKTPIEEMLYSAMEEFTLDIIIGKGPSAKSMRLSLPKFTLIGATTKVSMLSSPLRDRFGSLYHLNYYSIDNIEKIILRSAKLLGISIKEKALNLIAECSRQTPRIANRLLKRVRDYACIANKSELDENIVKKAFTALGIDKMGLNEIDRQLIDIIIKNYHGGPVGLTTLAAATGEEKATIEDIYEPYLIKLGFLDRTPRGRIATDHAYEYLNIPYNSQLSLIKVR